MRAHSLRLSPGDRRPAGATLIESMIAMTLLAGIGAALFPLFTMGRKTLKVTSLRVECQRLVDLKIEQYRHGGAFNLIDIEGGDHFLGRPTQRNERGFRSIARTLMGAPSYCDASGISYANSPLWRGKVLGLRECVSDTIGPQAPALKEHADGSLEYASDVATLGLAGRATDELTACTSPTDQIARQRIPGFKLYVRLTRSSPWVVQPATPSNPASTGRDTADCPRTYFFGGVQDGIKVDVTGIIDSPNTLLSPNERECKATTTLEPIRQPFRFLLKTDGRIYDASGLGEGGGSSPETNNRFWTFQSIYSTDGTTPASRERGTSIRAFSVHPVNRSIWILKAGQLLRYSDCDSYPIDCSTAATTNGISDAGTNRGSWPSVQEFTVSDSIQSIAVDYLRGRVYAITSATHDSERALGTTPRGRGVYRIALAGTPATDLPSINTATANTELVSLAAEGSSGLPGDVPFFIDDRLPDRVIGMFTNPTADTAFVFGPFTAPEWNATQNVTGVFLGTDYRMLTPIAVFPEKILGLSP